MKKVIGIGNALTDYVVNLPSDDLLARFGLPKGSMSLVDALVQQRILQATADLPRIQSPGGSAANTIGAMARLGTEVGYIGKVGADPTGLFFNRALEKAHIAPTLFQGTGPSGRCISLVSPDGERTMVTFLGAALELSAAEIVPSLFQGYDCVYLEGYLVQDHELIRSAVQTARSCGLRVALDLASFNIVNEHLDFLHGLVAEYVDILFANEQEAAAFTGRTEPLDALGALSRLCELAVVKTGPHGACIAHGGETVCTGTLESVRRVDTTGAGDFYAAGFLAGLCEGLTLRQCGTLGAIAAGKVIEVVGTVLDETTWTDVRRMADRVRTGECLF